jgi:hypothetical protein
MAREVSLGRCPLGRCQTPRNGHLVMVASLARELSPAREVSDTS